MTNSADPDQLPSSEANWYGSTLLAYPGSAELGLILQLLCLNISCFIFSGKKNK